MTRAGLLSLAFLLSASLWAPGLAPAAHAAAPASVLTLRKELTELEGDLASAQARLLDVPVAKVTAHLATARQALDTASLMAEMGDDPARAEAWLMQARQAMIQARMRMMPSRAVEARGIFLDAGALPKTPEGVRYLLSSLSRSGFNVIYPEVFRRGYTLYPSRLTEQDPEFRKSPDLLKTLVSEAHALGMEVHPWIWTLRVRSPGFGNPVLDRLPALSSRATPAPPAAAHGAADASPRFLSAAEPRARQWVGLLVDEMFSRYGFDGLMLDYIRYDETIPDDETSRTYFALDYFAKYGQYPPSPIPPNSQAAADWQGWREEQVNLLVKDLSERLKRKNPRIIISASTFRGESFARLTKMQHWRHWSNNRWVNVVTSMLYTSKVEDLATWLSWETDGYKRPNLLYPVLGPHRMNDASWESLAQVRLIQQKNQPGVIFFAMSHVPQTLLSTLAEGPFRRKAMLPHRNSALAAKRVLQDLDGSYLRYLIANGDFDVSASSRALSQEVQAISSMIPAQDVPFAGSAPVISRMEELKALSNTMASRKQLALPIAQEINDRMAYAQGLMRANAHEVAVRGFIPSTRPPIEVKVDMNEVRD